MPSYTVTISATGQTLWSATVNARNPADAKAEAIAVMQRGGGYRPKVGTPPPARSM